MNEAVSLIHCPAPIQKGDVSGEQADLTRAIELNAKVAWFYVGRGVARFDENQLDRAAEDFTQALKAQKK